MKTKRSVITVCCILAAAFALGAAGVITFAGEDAGNGAGADRLVGVLITQDYLDLFDSDRFFSDDANKLVNGGEIGAAERAPYEGRLYATLVETGSPDGGGDTAAGKEYVFKGVDGIRFFAFSVSDGTESYSSMKADEGVTDADYHVTVTDEGESMSLKGTVYIVPRGGGVQVYLNPVYQSPDGAIYAVSNTGVHAEAGNALGPILTQKITEDQTETSGDTNTSVGSEVEVTVCAMDKPLKIALSQFDGEDALLERKEYAPGTLPEHMDALPDTQYIVVETVFSAGSGRTIFQKKDAFAYAFYCRDDGICIKQECEINWSE